MFKLTKVKRESINGAIVKLLYKIDNGVEFIPIPLEALYTKKKEFKSRIEWVQTPEPILDECYLLKTEMNYQPLTYQPKLS